MARQPVLSDSIEVSLDGNTVWVSSEEDGSCIGRFSKKFGMDVHKTGTQQLNGEGECLHCTHVPGTQQDWFLFCELMFKHYKVSIPTNLLRY